VSPKQHLKSIDGFYKSYALIPEDSDHTDAIVFVHGFGGSPTGTWCDFQGLSQEYSGQYPWWRTATLFFYSYESKWEPIHSNAVRFRDFLEDVLGVSSEANSTASDRTVNAGRRIPVDWTYKNLLLVGHSEGAVVIRRMILNRIEALVRSGRKSGLEDS
jgi:pimeloyl-ACP methyl ester carboxylesterase